ncbi:hypothetical protein B0F90DRAFT_1820119 [Multifurca ochricompacta]|uniref:Uncharacterized protein n=1 Tax=Multifurca ochricompacta TaxID=376703 RepID=A0AAD4LZC0_9AGAM|nr:hypothetical protein B0F90DRAFT_1820119 [Multifurca ochricompacta]
MHITRPSERARRADVILKEAMKQLEQNKDIVGIDNYNMAMGWLTAAGDLRDGLENKNAFGRLQQSQIYLDKAQETNSPLDVIDPTNIPTFLHS